MLRFFKRQTPAAPARPVRPASRPAPAGSRAAALPPEPPPLPEVHEGNLESDWALWEDSVAFQDSQLPSAFNPLETVKVKDGQAPAPGAEHDPYARVPRRG